MPAQTTPALDQLLDGLTTAIAKWIHPALGLVDAHTGKPTPPDHYGQTCAALALCSPIKGNTSKRDSALAAWMSTPDSQIDHLANGLDVMAELTRLLHENEKAEA